MEPFQERVSNDGKSGWLEKFGMRAGEKTTVAEGATQSHIGKAANSSLISSSIGTLSGVGRHRFMARSRRFFII
jgi:hypothetical protein